MNPPSPVSHKTPSNKKGKNRHEEHDRCNVITNEREYPVIPVCPGIAVDLSEEHPRVRVRTHIHKNMVQRRQPGFFSAVEGRRLARKK